MKAILYARCSSKEQGKSHLGIEAQIADMHRFCSLMNIDVVSVEEEVVSGTYPLERRPVLQTAIAKSKKIKDCFVLTSRIDRIARKMEFVLEAVDEGVKIVECGLNATRMEIQMRAMFAEEERLKISQRTSAALMAKRLRGEPLGFMITDATGGREKALNAAAEYNRVEADKYAEWLRPTLERMIRDKMTLKGMADELNKLKIRTARGKTFYPKTISNIVARFS
jgi:DNA invertase Pin-like site-specific DNA recombinase